MVHIFSVFTLMTLVHALITISVSIRVIKVRLPVATSLAWLIFVFFLPLLGAIAYLVLGEKRLGRKFTARSQAIKDRYNDWLQDLPAEIRCNPQRLSPQARSLSRLAETTLNIPAMSGNRLQLLDAAEPILRAMISDIDRAKRFCHLEFYIWTEGGMADDVGAALLRAAGRDVTCRVLLDAVGSARFLKGHLVEQLRAGGVEVALFGSVNLDVRSFWLDFEVTLGVYDPDFAKQLLALQDTYIEEATLLNLQTWQQRPGKERFIENLVRLTSPLL